MRISVGMGNGSGVLVILFSSFCWFRSLCFAREQELLGVDFETIVFIVKKDKNTLE